MSNTHQALPQLARLYSQPAAAAVLNEAMSLLGDGIAAAAIESGALNAAMPSGVLSIIDAVSLEVIDHQLHESLHALSHAQAHEHSDHSVHQHEHEHDHGHGHQSQAGDGHKHDHDHDHNHDHDHGHDHDHAHEATHHHAHHGTHDHKSDHPHDHSHDHAHSKPAHSDKHEVSRLTESAIYVLEKMAHGYSRLGRAAGAGFYDYSETPPQLWSGLKTFERRNRGIPEADITDRLTHAAMLAALTVDDSADSELMAANFGPNIASSSAQVLEMLPEDGRHRFIDRCRELAARYGPRFEPSPAALTRLNRTKP
jgi:3-hydroxyacyl-CoA dehydrogenase